MRKTIVTVFVFLVLFGFAITGAFAQVWTWNPPAPAVHTGDVNLSDLAADPAADLLYGISDGAVVTVTAGSAMDGVPITTAATPAVLDLAVGFQGGVYVITNAAVKTWVFPSTYTSLPQQPLVPASANNGVFQHIAVGKNGKLFVLYEDPAENQYILVGNPPVMPGLGVKFSPTSLNLKSKGNWITCHLSLPGYNIKDIDTSSIKITQFVIGTDTYDVADIPIDTSAPMDLDLGTNKLMVKFVRYNKGNPSDPASLSGALSALLPSGPSKGKVDVTATVQASLNTGETFEGNVTFQVIVPKEKKGKP